MCDVGWFVTCYKTLNHFTSFHFFYSKIDFFISNCKIQWGQIFNVSYLHTQVQKLFYYFHTFLFYISNPSYSLTLTFFVFIKNYLVRIRKTIMN